jgi:hypothetical protein
MFCPNCGQQQASDETRFCSRCGFQLGVVKSALAAAGEGEEARGGVRHVPDAARRKKDLTLGAALMFLFALVVAAGTVELPPGHSNRIVVLVVAWLVLTLLINLRPLLRYFLGGGAASAGTEEARGPAQLGRAARDSALPPSRAVPAAELAARQFDTAEVAEPPSVAERTTNLLGRN